MVNLMIWYLPTQMKLCTLLSQFTLRSNIQYKWGSDLISLCPANRFLEVTFVFFDFRIALNDLLLRIQKWLCSPLLFPGESPKISEFY